MMKYAYDAYDDVTVQGLLLRQLEEQRYAHLVIQEDMRQVLVPHFGKIYATTVV